MEYAAAKPLLGAVRRLRLGAQAPGDAPEPLRSLVLEHGLGPVVEHLARWVSSDTTDRRQPEVLLRYFGLVRLPEDLEAIAASTYPTVGGGHRRRGLSTRQVQNLIRVGIEQLGDAPVAIRPSAASPSGRRIRWEDPFPDLRSHPRPTELRTLLWAWAQVPDKPGMAGSALLLYEHEHGIRKGAFPVSSRTQRQRLRRLAWSMLGVASYRASLAMGPPDSAAISVIGRTASSGLSAIPSTRLPLRPVSGTGPFPLLLAYPPSAVPLDLVDETLQFARHAVRERLPIAPIVVAILLDVVRRVGEARRPGSVPPEVISKVLTLSAILSKEHRDLTGIPVGDATLRQTEQLIAGGLSDASAAVVVVDTLRTSQEMNELALDLGMPFLAWRAARRFHRYLTALGDPEHDVEPFGWLYEVLLAHSRTETAIARLSRRPEFWLERATKDADRAAGLVFDTGELPVAWGVAAVAQRTEIDLTRAELIGDRSGAERTLGDVRTRLVDAEGRLGISTEPEDMDWRKARLALRLSGWRAATLSTDRAWAGEARRLALAAVGPWTAPAPMDQVHKLDRATRLLLGGSPSPDLQSLPWGLPEQTG